MTVIEPSELFPHLTTESAYEQINTLGVSFRDFANITSLESRLYGVNLGLVQDDNLKSVTFNRCVRNSVWKNLLENQDLAERAIGFNVSQRQHTEHYDFADSGRYALRFPGLEQIGSFTWTDVALEQGLTFKIQEGISPSNVNNRYIVELQKEFFDHPFEVVVRNYSNQDYIPIEKSAKGYPSKNVAGNWLIQLNHHQTGYTGNASLDVYSRRFCYVDVDLVGATDVDNVYPMYPDTNQIVPIIKRVLLSGTTYRFFIPLEVLVRPPFLTEQVDILNQEYYKLYDSLDFKERSITAGSVSVVRVCAKSDSSQSETFQVSANIISRENSVIELNLPELKDKINASTLTCDKAPSMTIELTYITNPVYLSDKYRTTLSSIYKAIAHKAAAELPTTACGCEEVKIGFIAEQQRGYTKVRTTFVGDTVAYLEYGNLHGQAVFGEVINNTPIYRRPIRMIHNA